MVGTVAIIVGDEDLGPMEPNNRIITVILGLEGLSISESAKGPPSVLSKVKL